MCTYYKKLLVSFLTVIAAITVNLTVSISTSYGESYSWKDSSGRTIYGTKPPKNARVIEPLQTKPISRYSSKKMLARLGWEKRSAIREKAIKQNNAKSKE